MSKVWKGAKKVFKKVVGGISKVAPVALAAGTIFFTAGAALGVPGTAGGWGGAVSSLTERLGAGEVLTNVLTGAVTQAGYGAVVGGAASLLTGGDPMKGLQFGAAGGAATGGLMGGLGMKTDPLAGIGETGAAPSNTTGGGPINLNPAQGPTGVPLPASAAATAPSTAAAPATGGGGLFRTGGWLERNQNLVGHAVKGLGGGLLGMAQGDDAVEAGELALERDEAERDYIRGNYGSGNVPGYRVLASTNNPSPAQRFDPQTYNGRYQYDPKSGQIVFVPNAQTA